MEDTVSERFKKLRKLLKLNQTELANGLRIKQASISAIENGGDPSIETLRKIAITYNVNLNWLVANIGTEFSRGSESIDQEEANIIQELQKQIFTQSKLNIKLNTDYQRLLAENKELKKNTA